MANAGANEGAATEHTPETQLSEILSDGAGLTSDIELKVIRNAIMSYSYPWKGTDVATQELQVVLQSKIEDQYCLGVVKIQKKDKSEFKTMQEQFKTGTTWKFKTVILLHSEKPAFIHTTCRNTVDLRKAQAQAILQSSLFPETPVPTCIADIS